MRTAEEASALMQLDGIDFQGFPLRIRRCQEYNETTAPPLKQKVLEIDTVALGIVSTQVRETPNKVFVGGIPRDWDEEKIKALLNKTAGKLKSFHLVRDNKDQTSKGYAFCEFATIEGVRIAMNTVNGMQVVDSTPGLIGGTKTLNVRRTGVYANQPIEGVTLPASALQQNVGMPGATIDQFYKTLYEDNISEYIKNMSILQSNSQRIHSMIFNEMEHKRLSDENTANNQNVKNYLRD